MRIQNIRLFTSLIVTLAGSAAIASPLKVTHR